jgi:hypothetical protein
MEQLQNRWTEFHEVLYWGVSLHFVHSNSGLNGTQVTDNFHGEAHAFMRATRMELPNIC